MSAVYEGRDGDCHTMESEVRRRGRGRVDVLESADYLIADC